MEATRTLKSRTALQLYLLLIAAVASLMLLANSATRPGQTGAADLPVSTPAVGYGYSGERPASLENRLEAIRLAALDPYRQHR